MAETTISWADWTFNPWLGCSKVSEACLHCYAESWAKRTGDPGLWRGERRKSRTWAQPPKWNRQAHETGRHVVFSASLADVFEDHPAVGGWREELWSLIDSTRKLFWLLLSKRPENFSRFLPWTNDPWAHVGLGVTAENQRRWSERLPILLATPAALRFVSVEPMLGRIDASGLQDLDLIICGGESGSAARPMPLEWARHLRDQCRTAGVAFHFKQRSQADSSRYNDFDAFPSDLRIRQEPRVVAEHARTLERQGQLALF